MTFEKMLKHAPELGGMGQVAMDSRCLNVTDNQVRDAAFAVSRDTKIATHLERDDMRDVLMLGDRGDFILGQLTHIDAVTDGEHGVRAMWLGVALVD